MQAVRHRRPEPAAARGRPAAQVPGAFPRHVRRALETVLGERGKGLLRGDRGHRHVRPAEPGQELVGGLGGGRRVLLRGHEPGRAQLPRRAARLRQLDAVHLAGRAQPGRRPPSGAHGEVLQRGRGEDARSAVLLGRLDRRVRRRAALVQGHVQVSKALDTLGARAHRGRRLPERLVEPQENNGRLRREPRRMERLR